MSLLNHPIPFSIVPFGLTDPAADKTVVLARMPFTGYVIRMTVSSLTALAASDTNYVILSLLDGGVAGAGTDSIVSYSSKVTAGDGAITAIIGCTKDLTTPYKVHKGDYVLFKYDEGGTGTIDLSTVQMDVVPGDPANDTGK